MSHPDNHLALPAGANAAHRPIESSNQSEFLLACLRAASLRAKLIATELDSVGVALRHNFVSHDDAVEWLHDSICSTMSFIDRKFAHDPIN